MEINRNQFMMLGLVVLALGIQFRKIDSFVLNEKTSAMIAKQLSDSNSVVTVLVPTIEESPPLSKRVVKPPKWLGWMLVSVGAVLCFHSLAMPKPG